MHEMSIAQSIFDIVEEEMARHGVEELRAINLAIGKMAAVVPQHLNLCFSMIADNSKLAGTILNVRETPLTYKCLACGNSFTAEDMVFQCPECNEENPDLVGGRELTIESMEVADEDDS